MKRISLKKTLAVWILPAAALAALSLSVGCKKEQPPAKQPAQQTKQDSTQASQISTDQPAAATVAVEQTTCPVMEGNPINKNIFIEYEGKKVYFCCPACPDVFKADPQKYIAKLPQFAK